MQQQEEVVLLLRCYTHYTALLSFEVEKPDINQSINRFVCFRPLGSISAEYRMQYNGKAAIEYNATKIDYIQYPQQKKMTETYY